ncbi:hypothetical protein H311_01396, partial [Anncaliia algerae PRA109]
MFNLFFNNEIIKYLFNSFIKTMTHFQCRYHEEKYPAEGDIVVGKVSQVTDLGVFILLTEYNNLEGLIVIGELTRKRIS